MHGGLRGFLHEADDQEGSYPARAFDPRDAEGARMTAPLTIDPVALDARKPRAGPLIEPAEAVAIALSMLPITAFGHICSPESPGVRLILKALQQAGYKIVPR